MRGEQRGPLPLYGGLALHLLCCHYGLPLIYEEDTDLDIDALSYHLRDQGVILRHDESMERIEGDDDGVLVHVAELVGHREREHC